MTSLLRFFSLALIISLITFGLTGCKTRRFPADQEPALQINWARETPQSLLATMANSTTRLNTFTAYFQISMDPPPAKMPSSFAGILYLSKDGDNTRLRIKALHLFGTTLFDMVAQGGTTQVYIPAKQTMYVGKTDKDQQEQAQGPQQIFSSLMINFASLHALPGSSLEIEGDKVRMLLVDGEMWLDKATGQILSLAANDKTIIYSDYQQLVADLPAMPTDIQLTTAQGKARCQLKEITIHASLGQENFDLSSYQVKETKDLAEAGKE